MVKSISTAEPVNFLGPSLFFLTGFVYYFFVPPLAFALFQDNDHVLRAERWISLSQYDVYYFLDGVIILVSWIFGSWLGSLIFKSRQPSSLDDVAYRVKSAWMLVAFLFALSVLFLVDAIRGGATFFTGYQDYNILVLGPFATMSFTAIMFRSFFYDKYVRMGFLLIFLMSAAILLGLGSRMLVMISMVVAAVDYYHTHRIKKLTIALLGTFILSVAMVMLAVGVVRDGGDINAESLLGVLFAEPLFTSISSLRYFVVFDGRQALAFPIDYISGFINFIPSIIFPGKIELMEKWSSIAWDYKPFGASALLANLYINFGFLYPFFIISVALHYSYLFSRAKGSRIFRMIYISSLPLLLFYIHREGFVTVVKVMYFNSLLLPITLVYLMKLMDYLKYSDVSSVSRARPS